VVKATNESQQCSTVEVEDVPRRTKGEERMYRERIEYGGERASKGG
jgi:hypothetical protein